ncbi:MAG: serine/threonine-protein kinase [Solirubrobacteraceae bacterium]
MKLEPGATLGDGRYRLGRRLGAGGMASVWLAADERLDRTVAVKIVADTLAGDERWVRRFTREARAAAGLSHRGVVSVFDYGFEDDRPYLVMEYVSGGTVEQRLSAATDLPDPCVVAEELLDALQAVHDAGILHRDVKPANLLLDDHGHVRLSDFGIAQPHDATALTATGLVVGTPRYLAPEVAIGGPASVQSDLYAAGVVLRRLAGEPPAGELAALLTALTADDPSARPASAAAALGLIRAHAPTPDTAATSPTASASDRAHTEATRPMVSPSHRTRTSPTRSLAQPSRRAQSAATRSMAPLSLLLRRLARAPKAAYAITISVIVVIVVVIVVVSAGGQSPSQRASATPSPAPAAASVSRQLQALERIVVSAARH